MEEMVWLYVLYPGDFKIESDGCLSVLVDRINEGIAFPFRVPKKLSFVELYDKLVEKLQIDSNLYEMVLRCANPLSTQHPPFVIKDDETVDWLIENRQGNTLHVNLNLNANEVTRTNIIVMPTHNGEKDINCIVNDNVEEVDTSWQSETFIINNVTDSPLARYFESVEVDKDVGVEEGVRVDANVGVDVSETLLVPLLDYSCLIPRDTTTQAGNIIVGGVDGLNDELNDIEPTGATEGNNVIPNSSDIINLVPSWRISSTEDFYIEQEFSTKDALLLRLKDLAIAFHFEFKTSYSDKKRIELKCHNNVCLWRLRATCVGSSSKKFVVRIYNSNHSCPLIMHQTKHKQADSNFICSNIEEKFQDPERAYPPRDIISDFQAKHGHKVSYTVAYNAQKKAMASVRGTLSENFSGLPKFFHALEVANPGTKTYIETDDKNVFKYCFMALGQCIRGYSSSVLPVVCVDGTFLTGTYRSTLLLAVCQDGVRGLYPLAFAVVDSENNSSWTWFFERLITITGDTSEVVILCDRHPSIRHGFQKVFKNARYGNCCLHMKRNLISRYPKCKLSYLFKKAYKAYTIPEFQDYFEPLCEKVKLMCEESGRDDDIEEYLSADEYRYWSRAHFDSHRYHVMTTNPAESFNNKIKVARQFPILALLKQIRSILQKWFAKRNHQAQSMKNVLTPLMDKKLKKRYDQMREAKLTAIEICRGSKYQVCVEQISFVVDLEALTCSCRRFDLKKFPCIHALCAAKEVGMPFTSLCSKYHYSSLYKTAYSESIYPPLNEKDTVYPESVLNRVVLTPDIKNGRGRAGTKRKKSAGEPREAGEASKRKKLKQSEVQLGETSKQNNAKQPEVQPGEPRKKKKTKQPVVQPGETSKIKNAKQPELQSGETSKRNKPNQRKLQSGETSNEPQALKEKPPEPRKKKKPKKYISLDCLTSRGV